MTIKAFLGGFGVCALLAAGACSGSGRGASAAAVRADDDHETPVTLDECPEAVRATILAHTSAGNIRELEIDHEGGADVYDVEVAGGGEFSVAPDGAYLGPEADGDDGDEGDDD